MNAPGTNEPDCDQSGAWTIEPYGSEHRSGVIALWREVFPNAPQRNDPATDIERKLRIQRELFLVAVSERIVLGTVMSGYDGHRGWIYYLTVHPAHRRRGIGADLMRCAESRLAELGCPKVNLQVRSGNRAVVEFYRKLGYEVEERVSLGKSI